MAHRTRTSRGFTLIELLVVISIIAILAGISFPFLRTMARTSNVQMAANGVETAVSGARAYATRLTPRDFFVQLTTNPPRTAQNDGDGYSGAAVIVTPSNDLRIVENDAKARNPGGQYLELLTAGQHNGYRHIDGLDDLRMPTDVMLLGIVRDTADGIKLLPPPFAIRFDQRGNIVLSNGADTHRYVVYDSNGDGRYDEGDGRAAIDLVRYARGNASRTDEGRAELPWERLETVIGVVVFDPRDAALPFDPARATAYSDSPSGGESQQILDQLGDQAQVLFFNRYTGQNIAE